MSHPPLDPEIRRRRDEAKRKWDRRFKEWRRKWNNQQNRGRDKNARRHNRQRRELADTTIPARVEITLIYEKEDGYAFTVKDLTLDQLEAIRAAAEKIAPPSELEYPQNRFSQGGYGEHSLTVYDLTVERVKQLLAVVDVYAPPGDESAPPEFGSERWRFFA